VRVYLDTEKLKAWVKVNSWLWKLKTKREQNYQLLLSQINEAGYGMLSVQRVRVEPERLRR
jgi:formylmethanofuran dehydrogenase subunit E